MCFDTYFIHCIWQKTSKPLWTSKFFTIFQYFLTVHGSDVRCWKSGNSHLSDALSCLRLGRKCALDLVILDFSNLRFFFHLIEELMPVAHVVSVLDKDAPVANEVLRHVRGVSFFVLHQRASFWWRRNSNLLRHQRLFHLTQELQHYVTTNQRFVWSRESPL